MVRGREKVETTAWAGAGEGERGEGWGGTAKRWREGLRNCGLKEETWSEEDGGRGGGRGMFVTGLEYFVSRMIGYFFVEVLGGGGVGGGGGVTPFGVSKLDSVRCAESVLDLGLIPTSSPSVSSGMEGWAGGRGKGLVGVLERNGDDGGESVEEEVREEGGEPGLLFLTKGNLGAWRGISLALGEDEVLMVRGGREWVDGGGGGGDGGGGGGGGSGGGDGGDASGIVKGSRDRGDGVRSGGGWSGATDDNTGESEVAKWVGDVGGVEESNSRKRNLGRSRLALGLSVVVSMRFSVEGERRMGGREELEVNMDKRAGWDWER
jgi:hypothetical protein